MRVGGSVAEPDASSPVGQEGHEREQECARRHGEGHQEGTGDAVSLGESAGHGLCAGCPERAAGAQAGSSRGPAKILSPSASVGLSSPT